jgi:hypothetical protein
VTAASPHSGDDTHDLIDDALYQLGDPLATSPEQAELSYSPDSPIADSRWPYDW